MSPMLETSRFFHDLKIACSVHVASRHRLAQLDFFCLHYCAGKWFISQYATRSVVHGRSSCFLNCFLKKSWLNKIWKSSHFKMCACLMNIRKNNSIPSAPNIAMISHVLNYWFLPKYISRKVFFTLINKPLVFHQSSKYLDLPMT
jgi:hypothetical protein